MILPIGSSLFCNLKPLHFPCCHFSSVAFAVVHHGSTWLTKTTYSQHQNVRKATHYDETLAFPIRMINQNYTPRRRLIFRHQRKILLDHVASIGSRYSQMTTTELTAETKTRTRSCANDNSYLITQHKRNHQPLLHHY